MDHFVCILEIALRKGCFEDKCCVYERWRNLERLGVTRGAGHCVCMTMYMQEKIVKTRMEARDM